MASGLAEKCLGEETQASYDKPEWESGEVIRPVRQCRRDGFLHKESLHRQVSENFALQGRESETINCLAPYKQYIW